MLRNLFNFLLLLSINGCFSEPAISDHILNSKNSEDYCITEVFHPTCFENEVIVIGEALFGRRKLGRCLKNEKDGLNFDDPKVLGCYSDVKTVIDQKCSLRQSCEVRVIELSAEVPCYSYLKYYLEVTWSCIRVVQEGRQCKVAANNVKKHILSPASNNPICGSRNQPWIVETDPGQKILLTLIPYNDITGNQFSIFFKSSAQHESCQRFGHISEKYSKRQTDVCLSENRESISDKQVFTSNTSSLEIVLSSISKSESEKIFRYLLSVEATGCSDLIPPADAWLKRTENEATIGCYSTRLRWQLKCQGQRWVGVIGNCSYGHEIQEYQGNEEKIASKSQGLPMEFVVLIMVAAGIIFVCCLILVTCYCNLKRKKIRMRSSNPQTFQESPNISAPKTYTKLIKRGLEMKYFPAYVLQKEHVFPERFKSLPEIDVSKELSHVESKANRYKNIVPYEDNRVKLKIPECEGTDYINASYVENVLDTTLIATQGPTKESIESFWKMIWQENIGIIVQLCNFVELTKVKCEEYWPSVGSTCYGDTKITNQYCCQWPEYKVTQLILEKDIGSSLSVIHLHYTKWPDHGTPENTPYFLEFNRHFRIIYEFCRLLCYGVVVHSSAGIGRTGTFIAITDLITRGLAGEPISVSKCVAELRRSRMKMVENEDQYHFIYECLVDETILGELNFCSQDFLFITMEEELFKKRLKNQYQRLQTLLDSEYTGEMNIIQLVTSSCRFHMIRSGTSEEFWADIPQECDLVIVLNEKQEYFQDFKLPVEKGKNVITFLDQEDSTDIKSINLFISKKDNLDAEERPKINLFYENSEDHVKSENKQITLVFVQINENMDFIYGTFIKLFRMLKPNSLTSLFCSDENMAGIFMTFCNILSQVMLRDEVAIFQNILEIQCNGYRYSLSLEDYEKLHQLVFEYLQDETNKRF